MIRVATGDRIRSSAVREPWGQEIRRDVDQGPVPQHLLPRESQPKATTDEERVRRSLVTAGAQGGGRTAGELARSLALPVALVREVLAKVGAQRRVLDAECLVRRGALLEWYL